MSGDIITLFGAATLGSLGLFIAASMVSLPWLVYDEVRAGRRRRR